MIVLFWLIHIVLNDTEAREVNCDKHPIYCQVVDNNRFIDRDFAMQLSNTIHDATQKHGIPTRIFTAILAQESAYKLDATGCKTGLIKVVETVESDSIIINKPKKVIKYKKATVCSDFGIGQIWYKTAHSYNFDISRLTTDLEYSINAAARVLSDFQKMYSAKEVDWWTRYNASSRHKREIYKKLVERYL